MYFVYLIECEGGSIYTGLTTDVARRFEEHAAKKGAKYTRAHRVVKLLYAEKHKNRSKASKREAEIKSWKRERKLELVKHGKA